MTDASHRDLVVIIGAGMGGLAAAIDLAAAGVPVRVYERATSPGGKMRTLTIGGEPIDAGPTVLTYRKGFEALFSDAGANLDDHVTFHPAEILARHAWDGSGVFDLYADPERAIDAVGDFSGAQQARQFRTFLRDGTRLYAALETTFLTASKPSAPGLTARILAENPAGLAALRPFASLWDVLGEYFTDTRLHQLYGRFATYCGSSPFRAPATLMMIAALEHQGVWLVEGGMKKLAEAMAALAVRLGVEFRFDTEVSAVNLHNGRATGVTLSTGETVSARAVLANCDPEALRQGLLGLRGALPAKPPSPPSLSAIVWTCMASHSGFPLDRHNVFFSRDYPAEFRALFDEQRLSEDPTIYVCAQDRGHAGSPAGPERFLILMNAPADGDRKTYTLEEIDEWQARIFSRLRSSGLDMKIVASEATAPDTFAKLFPGSGGAIYGRALHGWQAAFQRPAARSKRAGLYLAGGGVHPGPGVPTAMLSGRTAARAILADLASTKRLRPAGIAGSTLTPSAPTDVSASS